MRSSGTLRRRSWPAVDCFSGPAFPDGRREAREDFIPFVGLESNEEMVVLIPDLAEEALESPPAAVALGAGLNGKS
jgi:hypothetical protein